MTKTKTTALATLLIAALALAGCSRNTNQAGTNSTLIRLRAPYALFESEPLVVQVSEGSKAYIWQYSDKLAVPNEPYMGKGVPASTLADVQPQADIYKQAQDRKNQSAPVLITGDDHAKCGAVFEAIANAKRAGITVFYSEIWYRKSGATGAQTDWEGYLDKPILSIDPSSKPVTITISKDGTLALDNKPVSLNDLGNRLFEIRGEEALEKGNIRFIVEVDAQTEFNLLRFAFSQIWRTSRESVTLELRELK